MTRFLLPFITWNFLFAVFHQHNSCKDRQTLPIPANYSNCWYNSSSLLPFSCAAVTSTQSYNSITYHEVNKSGQHFSDYLTKPFENSTNSSSGTVTLPESCFKQTTQFISTEVGHKFGKLLLSFHLGQHRLTKLLQRKWKKRLFHQEQL